MNDYNDEAVIRLGEKCLEHLTEEYLARHSENDLESFKSYLKSHLADSWLRSIVDADEVIACMQRVRQEKIDTDSYYREKCKE